VTASVVIIMSTSPTPSLPLSTSEFTDGGTFCHEIVGELDHDGSSILVISTNHPGLISNGPEVYEISPTCRAVFFKKSFLDTVWEFVEAALQGTDAERRSEMHMIGAVLNRAIVAVYRESSRCM
jgi:hypothetical protein